MAANPNLIGGGRYTRAEVSGDKRRFQGATVSKSKLLRRLWRYLGRNRLLIVLAVILSLSSSMLALYGPKLSGEAINAIDVPAGQVDFDTVFRCASLMVVCYICSACLTYLLNVVMIRLSRTVAKQMRHDIFENLTALPVSYFDRFQTGDIISTVTYDVDTVNQSLSTDLLQILQSTVTVTVSLVFMLTIAPKLVLISPPAAMTSASVPYWPSFLLPQHQILPSLSMATTWSIPAETMAMLPWGRSAGMTETSTPVVPILVEPQM